MMPAGPSVGIVALGTIGRQEFALWRSAGFEVMGYDTSSASLEAATGTGAPGRIAVTSDASLLRDRDVLVLCLPTADPRGIVSLEAFDQFERAFGRATPSQLVIVASSVPIGFSRRFAERIGARRVAHAPERFDPGRGLELKGISRVVGANSMEVCSEVATLYERSGVRTHKVHSLEIAEASKILENTFRLVNIALVNEFAAICDRLGLDAAAVIDAAATKPFAFMAHYPGPGAGGTCIPVIPRFLLAAAEAHHVPAPILESAIESNDTAADRIAKRVPELVGRAGRLNVLVVGATYKADYPDSRGSSALRLVQRLQQEHDVSVVDPLIAEAAVPKGVSLYRELPERSFDVAIIAVAHHGIQRASIDLVGPLTIDLTRGQVRRAAAPGPAETLRSER